MNISALRQLLRPTVGDLKDQATNARIPELCEELGLPVPADEGSKRERFHAAFDELHDNAVPVVAENLIRRGFVSGQLRNDVQDVLWAGKPAADIPKRARRELARALQRQDLFHHWPHFETLLKSIFVIRSDSVYAIFGGSDTGLLADIHRHFVNFPEDADVEKLFDDLNVYALSNQRFSRFLEGLVSADVQVDAENQVGLVDAINAVLRNYGAELREVSQDGGYAVYRVVTLRLVRGRPKNLIFASTSKPDIRFRDAVNNDIEIASNADKVLVYDRPLGVDGLRWQDLQNWWADLNDEQDQARAKKSLYKRLRSCLPDSSPPQKNFFRSFFAAFQQSFPELPALLPEVWLHWDPKTVALRGTDALLTHRMDFLMLLPGGARVVLEVDGKQHYGDDRGLADPARYAQLMAGHRELTLAGYEVYRFSGIELREDQGLEPVKTFFEDLFTRHGVRWTSGSA